MRRIKKLDVLNNRGQNLVEYAMVAAIITAAMVAMSTYVFRSLQATQQMIYDEFQEFSE